MRVSIEVRRGTDGKATAARLKTEIKEKFELLPDVVTLETGTLAREFEANVKTAAASETRDALSWERQGA